MMALTPVALITGASSGIGAALARVFAAHGHETVLVGRREAMLHRLADEIASGGRSRPLVLPFDLTRLEAPARIAQELSSRRLEPAYVVNNAGYGLLGRAAELDRAEQLAMIDLNVRALTDLSLRFIDSLGRHHGGILNVASISGFFPGPGMALYNATKAYVLSLSEALHTELAPRGIRVTVVCPGPVPTGFQARAGIGDGQLPRLLVRSAEQVAQEGYRAMMRGQRVVVPGWGNRLIRFAIGLAPRRFVLSATYAATQKRNGPAKPVWPKRPRP
jgi:short-subunit dehydrogenase